jgi:hypothetical protein
MHLDETGVAGLRIDRSSSQNNSHYGIEIELVLLAATGKNRCSCRPCTAGRSRPTGRGC